MLNILLNNIPFDSLSCFSTLSMLLIYEYILDRNPMNSVIGMLEVSSLNFPITFLLVLS